MRILSFFPIIAMTIMLLSCGGTSDSSRTEKYSAPGDLDKQMSEELFKSYLKVQEALADENVDGAQRAAREMVTTLGNSKDRLAEKILYDVLHISGNSKIEHQREHFNILTDNMYALAQKMGQTGNLYLMNCPEAQDGKGGKWLSDESESQNPYSRQMPDCGKVIEKVLGR